MTEEQALDYVGDLEKYKKRFDNLKKYTQQLAEDHNKLEERVEKLETQIRKSAAVMPMTPAVRFTDEQ